MPPSSIGSDASPRRGRATSAENAGGRSVLLGRAAALLAGWKEVLVIVQPEMMPRRLSDPETRQRRRNFLRKRREAFPCDAVPRYLIFDNDKKYGAEVLAVIEHRGSRRKQITPCSPFEARPNRQAT